MLKQKSGSLNKVSPVCNTSFSITRSLAFLFAIISLSIQSNAQLYQLDKSTLEELSEDRKEENAEFYSVISNTTNYFSLAIPVSLFIAGAITKDGNMKKNALIASESIAVSTIFTFALKNTIKRQRPFAVDSLIRQASSGGGYSFPSGHTSEAFSAATSLCLAYPKWYVIVPSYLWASSVAYSRMYLGVHYPSDILGGAIVGSGSALLTYKINKWMNQKKLRKNLSVFSY